MDSCMEMAAVTDLVTTMCGTRLRPCVQGAARATVAGWPVIANSATIRHGHRYNQFKLSPRMGPLTCSPPV